jgi:argininosuccinate synthase
MEPTYALLELTKVRAQRTHRRNSQVGLGLANIVYQGLWFCKRQRELVDD